jgi:hypothetical protein
MQVKFPDYPESCDITLRDSARLKPLSEHPVKDIAQLKDGTKVLLNYNFDQPGELGFWYKAVVVEINVGTQMVTCEVELNRMRAPDCLDLTYSRHKLTVPLLTDEDDETSHTMFYFDGLLEAAAKAKMATEFGIVQSVKSWAIRN